MIKSRARQTMTSSADGGRCAYNLCSGCVNWAGGSRRAMRSTSLRGGSSSSGTIMLPLLRRQPPQRCRTLCKKRCFASVLHDASSRWRRLSSRTRPRRLALAAAFACCVWVGPLASRPAAAYGTLVAPPCGACLHCCLSAARHCHPCGLARAEEKRCVGNKALRIERCAAITPARPRWRSASRTPTPSTASRPASHHH